MRERENEKHTRIFEDSSRRGLNSIWYTTGPENSSGTEIYGSLSLHPTIHANSTRVLFSLIETLLRECCEEETNGNICYIIYKLYYIVLYQTIEGMKGCGEKLTENVSGKVDNIPEGRKLFVIREGSYARSEWRTV